MPRKRFADDQLVVCVESFSSSDEQHGSCARGVRLLGSHPIVVKRPAFFAPADTPDDQLAAIRREIYAASGAPPPA
jgi:hypothetical protein